MPYGRTLRRAIVSFAGVAVMLAVAPAAAAIEPEPASSVDTVGPVLHRMSADPALVDVSTAPAAVAVSARLADPDGVASVTVRLGDGPVARLALSSGTAAEGMWSGVAIVPAYAAAGAVIATVNAMDSTGAPSAPVFGAALDVADAVPAVPSQVSVAAAGVPGTLHVSWQPPAANGGSPVTSYSVALERAPGTDPSAAVPPAAALDATARSFTVTGLSASARYLVRVAAANAVGSGAPLRADAHTDPDVVTVPDAPTAVAVVPGDRSLAVAWTPPRSTGGVPLSSFHVVATPRSVDVPPVSVVAPPAAVSADVAGLVNGVTYDVAVSALNVVGLSLPSGSAAGTPRDVSGAPVLATVSAFDGVANVSWTPPVSDGGAPVLYYVIDASPSGLRVTVPGDVLHTTVRRVVNGVPTTFTVTAVNAAGAGPASARSAPVVPHQAARLVVLSQPAGRITYGTPSQVTAALRNRAGIGIPGQRVELQARIRPSSAWSSVASATTRTGGVASFRVVLPATAALRLYHPLTTVQETQARVRSVYVFQRVGAKPNTTRVRLGTTLVVRGPIAPDHRVGSKVRLQRYSRGRWHNLAYGAMTSRRSYAVTFTPRSLGSYTVRVIKPGDGDHETGISRAWRMEVTPPGNRDLARAIANNPRITLETTHNSGVRDRAHARGNVVDISNGRRAHRSSYENAPGGLTWLDRRVLLALKHMGSRGTVTVSEIAGGSHSLRSAHYSGKAIDISWVNGTHVGPLSNYRMVVATCHKFGATHVFHPRYDPVGGHQHHIHCDWS